MVFFCAGDSREDAELKKKKVMVMMITREMREKEGTHLNLMTTIFILPIFVSANVLFS